MNSFLRVAWLVFLALTIGSQSNLLAQASATGVFEEAACPFQITGTEMSGLDVTCGDLIVPEDRTNPDSPNIRLAVAIFHHPDGNPERDPLVYLMGGPGYSVVSTLPWVRGGQMRPTNHMDNKAQIYQHVRFSS